MAAEADAVEEGTEEGAESAPGGRKRLIIIIVAALVLAGGGFGAWKAFSGKGEGKKAEKVQLLPPRYINLDPPFVVNFQAESAVRFLQVTVGVMTRDPATEQLIKDNDPRVRNDMLMILSGQSYETVSSAEGKEALRQRCLEAARAIVNEMQGDPVKVEALYFTSFVMQ
jgi:flagellar FliL protein